MARGPRTNMSRGMARRWAGLGGASRFQQARGVHFQPRIQPEQTCFVCGRVGTRAFVLADMELVDGQVFRNKAVCSHRDACLRRADQDRAGEMFLLFKG
jgi:hypothetical protein